jgi:hypothetical protein
MPLKWHFDVAGVLADAAEMTPIQRIVRVLPPPRKGTIAVQIVHVAAIVAKVLSRA